MTTTRATTIKINFQKSDNAVKGIIALFWMALFLASCAGPETLQAQQQATGFFRPATPQTELLTPTPQLAGPADLNGTQPTLPVQCKDQLTFIRDITITDGTILAPDSTLDKRWEVENSGDCNWDKDYRLRLIAGPDLGTKDEQALFPARSGTRAVIRLVFKAPVEPGAYRSAWQAYNPAGEPFGDPFFIDFVVQ